MQTEKIEIPIEALDQATTKLGSVHSALARIQGQVDQSSQNSSKRLREMSGATDDASKKMAAFAAVQKQKAAEIERQNQKMVQSYRAVGVAIAAAAVAIKKGYDFAREGAQIDFTKIKFDRLAQTIGTTGESLLSKLRPATRGTMSDMQLISSATDTMSLGLVKSEKDAVRLSTVMSGLGMDMNQVVLALSNQTTMRFDQLGVAVSGFDERLKKLKDSGMDVNSAFTEAFLQQAEEQLQKVGHAADTSLGAFMRLEAASGNITDRLKEDWAELILPVIEYINKQDELGRIQMENEGAFESYARSIGKTAAGLDSAGFGLSKFLKLQEMEKGKDDDIREWGDAVAVATGQVSDAIMTQEQFRQSMGDLANVMRTDLTDAQQGYNEKIAELQQKYKEANTGTDRSAIIDQIRAETDAYNDRATAIMFNIQQQAIMAAAESGQIDYSQASAAISTLAQSYGLIDENQAKVMEGTQALIDTFSQTGNIDNFTAGLMMLRDAALEDVPAIDSSTDSVQTFANQLEQAITLIKQLPESGTTWSYGINLSSGETVITSGGQVVKNTGTSPSTPIMQATGGSNNGWRVVGERGWEYISPGGYVYTHAQSKALARGGLRASRGYALGGNIGFDTGEMVTSLLGNPVTSGNLANSYVSPSGGNRGGSQTTTVSPSVVSSIVTPIVQTIAAPIVTGVSRQIEQQSVQLQVTVARMTGETKKTNSILSAILAKVASDNGIASAFVTAQGKYS